MAVVDPTTTVSATLFQHQRDACAFVMRQLEQGGGTALLMKMGTGKTLTSIAVIGALAMAGRIHRVLIVAPLSIVGVWREEFAKFATYDYSLVVLEGSAEKKKDTIRHMNGTVLQVIVVNYESAWRLEQDLAKWDADLILCDEGHKIKKHSIAAAKAMHHLGAKSRFRLLLTGTVITNKAIDVFSQYKFVNPAIFGPSFYAFRNRYFDMTGYGNHTPVLRRHMEPELTEKLHSIAFRATKAECLDLPEQTDMVWPVELEPAAARVYKALARDSYAELGGESVTAANVLTRLLRLSQLTGGFINSDDSGTPQSISTAKLDALAEIIESARQDGQKLVIIARFIPELEAITRLLDKQGIGYAMITGAVKDRDEQVARFQNDPAVSVFIGQIATAGLGITLTATSTMVFYLLDYSMSNFEQAKARIHRVGQRDACTYIYLTAKGTVDEKVLKALKSKADLARTLIDDYRKGLNPFED